MSEPRRVFRSVADLQAAINRFVAETNLDPKPFVWTADSNCIIAAGKRGAPSVRRTSHSGRRQADVWCHVYMYATLGFFGQVLNWHCDVRVMALRLPDRGRGSVPAHQTWLSGAAAVVTSSELVMIECPGGP
jgi:hypothetical protein